jgi:hypothetical protein
MPSQEDILKQINKIIEEAAEKFNDRIPGWTDRIWRQLQVLFKQIDTKGDKITPSVKNLRLIGTIGRKLEKIIVDKEYLSDVKNYIKAFNDITTYQNQYFQSLENEFKPTPLLQAIREQAVNSAIEGLTEAGLGDMKNNIKSTLLKNITTGGSYTELMKTMSGMVSDNNKSESSFSTKIRTYTITSIAQYSRNYSQTVAEGLNFKWFQYVGSVITTTRCFCHAMVKKRYFHKSEIPDIIKGDFDEFRERECEINDNTDLPDGLIKGTNISNFMTYAGGWNCQHSIFPVPPSAVPQELRDKFKDVP